MVATLLALLPAFLPLKGLYLPHHGNSDSICEQKIRPELDSDQKLRSIRVYYSGDCADQGPFRYPCAVSESPLGWSCGLPGIRFEFTDARNYRWVNEDYGFTADFSWSSDHLD